MQCKCEQPAALRTVKKEGPTQGEQFYCCAISKDKGGCDLFHWIKEELNNRPRPEKRKWENKGGFQPFKKPYIQGGTSSPKKNEEPQVTSNADVERKLALKLIMDRLEKVEEDNGNFKTCYEEIRSLRSDINDIKILLKEQKL